MENLITSRHMISQVEVFKVTFLQHEIPVFCACSCTV